MEVVGLVVVEDPQEKGLAMKSMLHFITRSICVWIMFWSGIIIILNRTYPGYIHDDSFWRFVFGTFLPWVAVSFVARRYLDDKTADDPRLELISCRVFKDGDDTKIGVILLNASNAHINIIDWAYYVDATKVISTGSDVDVPRHKGVHRFTEVIQGNDVPVIKKIKVWTAQRRSPFVFLPPFQSIDL